MRVNFLLFIGYALFSALLGCDNTEPENNNDPANMSLLVEVNDDNSGEVLITATADNAIEFHFYLGDNGDGQPIVNSTGDLLYSYKSSGVYVIEARAYGQSGNYIKKEAQISVIVDDGSDPDDGYSTPPAYDGMSLLWSDEFNGNQLDESSWTYEIGTGSNGWGNNELQYYRSENTSLDNGYLTIEARNEAFGGNQYTSSRIVTMDKLSFRYGRVDIRAKLPKGQGIWPALWMLGSNFKSVGWPACGEIDIMEMVGGSTGDAKVYGTLHWDNEGSKADFGGSYSLSSGIFNDKFHVFTIIWDANEIKWYVDDVLFHTADITPAALSEFHENQFFIFNVAVGGDWPGSPDASTIFPQQLKVDYIRVFQPN